MEIITTHINADFDALASMLAAKKLYPKALLVFPGSQEKNLRDFFIQSTSYLLDIARIRDIEWEKIERLILVDIRQIHRIGIFSDLVNKRKDLDIHIYDHHPDSPEDIKGSLEVIKEVGSTTTILCEILQEKGLEISREEATILMLGVYEDTGSLSFPSTTQEDYKACAFLLSKGANLNVVSDMISRELTSEQIHILNELRENLNIHTIKEVEIAISRISLSQYMADLALIANRIREMDNLNVLFILASIGNKVSIIGRSRIKEVDAGEIMRDLGGGGHRQAASAIVRDKTLVEVEEELKRVLLERIKTNKVARDIMSFPVKYIEVSSTIQEADNLLTRYNINVLPCITEGRLEGLISRQIVHKALTHKLGEFPVSEFMTREFSFVSPESPLSLVQRYVVENNQRFLPVLDKKRLVGAITRTDLLRFLHADIVDEPSFPDVLKRKNVKGILEGRLPHRIFNLLQKGGEIAQELGFNAYAVGGFVRDMLMNKENLVDIDLVIEGDGIRFARSFAKKERCEIKVHKKFGTANLFPSEGIRLDIATARLEYYPFPASLPEVEKSSLKLDLYRRDFTINTLVIRLNPPNFGELMDFFGALRDIKERTIRVIHNLSFLEDPTRIFRAFRFMYRLNFHIGKDTIYFIRNAVKMKFLEKLTGPRLFSELLLVLSEDNPKEIIKALSSYQILDSFHPLIKWDERMERLLGNIEKVMSWFSLLFLGEKFDKQLIYLWGLLDGLKEDDLVELATRVTSSKKKQNRIAGEKIGINNLIRKVQKKEIDQNYKTYLLFSSFTTESLLFVMAKTEKEYLKKSISLYFTYLKGVKPDLSGNDLITLGFRPGRIFQKILSSVLEAKLNGRLKTKKEEIEFVKKRFLPRLEEKECR